MRASELVVALCLVLFFLVTHNKLDGIADAVREHHHSQEKSVMRIDSVRFRATGTEARVVLLKGDLSTADVVGGVSALMSGDPKYTCWKIAEGELDVTTVRKASETEAECQDRHDDAVAALMEEYPSTGECD